MTINNIIKGQRFDEERALYHLTDARVEACTFAGPAAENRRSRSRAGSRSPTAISPCAIRCGTRTALS